MPQNLLLSMQRKSKLLTRSEKLSLMNTLGNDLADELGCFKNVICHLKAYKREKFMEKMEENVFNAHPNTTGSLYNWVCNIYKRYGNLDETEVVKIINKLEYDGVIAFDGDKVLYNGDSVAIGCEE